MLAVMVGETVQEMQLAGWIGTTTLNIYIPDWAGVWFCLFPTAETLSLQVVAVIYILGSYFAARYFANS